MTIPQDRLGPAIGENGAAGDRTAIRAIDCDVHPIFADEWTRELGPYFSKEWRIRLQSGADYQGSDAKERGSLRYSLPHNCFYPRLGAPLREDLIGPSGEMPAVDERGAADELLDQHGIDRAVLIPQATLGLGAFPDAQVAVEVARATNEWLRDKWLSGDRRWRAAIVVSAQNPGAAAAEIERWASESRFVGVNLSVGHVLLGHNTLAPIYEAAAAHALPIILHPHGGEGIYSTGPAWAGATHYLDHRVCFTHPYQANLANLIATGTFERFPALKFVFAEVGYAWLPELMWRMDSTWKSQRASTPWLLEPPSEYIVRHCRFTTQPLIEPPRRSQIGELFEMIAAEKTLVFSTDYPHWDSEEPDRVIKDLPAAMRERIMFGNALDLFGPRLA